MFYDLEEFVKATQTVVTDLKEEEEEDKNCT